MPTILDRRASYQSQQQQTSPLPSPSLSPQTQQPLQQQQNRFWDDDQPDPEHGPESRFTNVDFPPASNKSPASSRGHRNGDTTGLTNSDCAPASCNPSNTAVAAAAPPAAASKRHSPSVTLKSGSTVMLPSKTADPLLNKEQCSMNSSVSSNPICQHFPCHMKQSTTSTKHSSSCSSSNTSTYHNKKSSTLNPNGAASGPLGSIPGNAVNATIDKHGRSSLRSQRKRRIKEAKSEYEERVEKYYQQLTVGCGCINCQNRFCASSKGGIRNLHPQAALVMAIQLASKPEDRLCHHYPQSSFLLPTDISSATKQQPHDSSQKGKSAHTPKPFLQSLFTSSAFVSLFGYEAQSLTDQERNRTSKSEKKAKVASSRTARKSAANHQRCSTTEPVRPTLHYASNRIAYTPFCGSSIVLGLHMCGTETRSVEEETAVDINDDFYYQIDNSDASSLSSYGSRSSDTSDEGLSLAIKPTATDLKTALEKLKCDQEDQVKRWIRSVFQNWDGLGNSFLTNEERITATRYNHLNYTALLVNLQDVEMFFSSVLHQQFSTAAITDALTESIETLLDRMNLNAESVARIETNGDDVDTFHVQSAVEWARSLICAFEWIQQRQNFSADDHSEKGIDEFCKLDGNATITWLPVLSHKYIQVLSKLSTRKQSLARQVLIDMLSCLDASRMHQLVSFLQQYLSDHFHTGPYKHGENDSVIMAVKSLELLYQANLTGTKTGSPIIPLNDFCNHDICKKLNIRDEYRIWKRVLQHGEGRHSVSTIAASQPTTLNRYGGLSEQQSRTRLFLTTTSTSILLPYPFANEYQFSWFSYPFLLPAVVKRKILHMDAMSQMSAEYEDACVNHTLVVHAQRLLSDAPGMVRNLETNLKSATCPYLLLEIRREKFVQDAFHQVSQQWANIKKPLKVKFIEGGEEGMDQGGVQKEFFGVLFEKLLSKETGLFDFDPETRLSWIRPVVAPDLRSYEMVGVMMGLAIYNGVIMNIQFPYLLWKILVLPSESTIDEKASKHELFTLQDLQEGWPSLASGLQQLLDWPDEVQDVFCRNYEITLDIFGKGIKTIPLIENGESIPVTNANREAFVKDYCTYFLYKAQREQLLAIRRGVWSVIGGKAMDLCTADVLQVIACGQQEGPDSLDLDMSELEAVTDYDDGYSAAHPVIRNFWSIVHDDLTPEQKRKLLLFVTASDRIPVGGLKELSFVLQRNGPDSDRLPTALTCFSRLLLPEYSSRDKLKERLITAIENAKGFGLV